MTHERAGGIVAANGEKTVGNTIQIIIRRTLFPIAKHPHRTLAVELSRGGVEAVVHSLAVVDSSSTGV